MTEALSFFPSVAYLALALFLPGTVLLVLARIDTFAAFCLGPTVTLASFAMSSVLYDALNIPWNGLTAVLGVVPLCLVIIGLRRRLPRCNLSHLSEQGTPPTLAVAAGVAVGSGLTALALVRGIGSAGTASQGWDPIFHANVLAWIRDSGSASPWSIAPIYAEQNTSYYPAGWHSFVSLYPGSPLEAANASAIIIGALVWPLGIALLASVVFPRIPAVWATAPVIAASFISFPFAQLLRSGQWPNGLATALVPGILAVAILLLRRVCSTESNVRHSNQNLQLAALGVAAVTGAAAAHPSSIFALGIAVLPFALAALLQLAIRGWRKRRLATVVVILALLGATTVTALLLQASPLLRSVMSYNRAVRAEVPDSLWLAFFDLPRFPRITPPAPDDFNLVVGLLVILGALIVLFIRGSRATAVSWAVFVVLYVLAAGPENPFRWLTGVWYKDTQRIAPFIAMFGSLLGALALVTIATILGRLMIRALPMKLPSIGAATGIGFLVVVGLAVAYGASSNFRSDDRISVTAHNYTTDPRLSLGVLAPGEQEFIAKAGSALPEEAKVIGDPFNGAALFYAVADRDVVYTQLGSASAGSKAKELLRTDFKNIHDDAAVCDAIAALGSTHFYQDPPGFSHGSPSVEAWPGFYDVPVDDGFELVATDGTRSLYRITACP